MNIMAGKWKQANCAGNTLGDKLQQWDESHAHMLALKKIFRQELEELSVHAKKARGERQQGITRGRVGQVVLA